MISAGGIPNMSLRTVERRPYGVQRKPIRVANGNGMSVQSNKITLSFGPKIIGDMLKNAVMPAVNRTFGRRFSYYVDAIAFLKQCGYTSFSSLPKTFQKSFTTRMLRILSLRHPAFKKKFDSYLGVVKGKGAKATRELAQAKLMYKMIHQLTTVQGTTSFKCTGSATPTPTSVVKPLPRPADPQIALQSALVAAVRALYGAATSTAAAKVVLKTQSWSTLKQLGIAKRIMVAFGRLGYKSASRSSSAAQRLVKKTVRNWRSSIVAAPAPASRPVVAPPPASTPPARPVARKLTRSEKKKLILSSLLTGLKTKGLATTLPEAVAFAKGQAWSTVLALKLHIPFIAALNAETKLGKFRPARSRNQTKAAQRLYLSLKK